MTRLPLYALSIAGVALGLALPNPSRGDVNIRKEWGHLTTDEQLSYIDAIKCLRDRPSALASDDLPGVKDRFDDFVATHITYTPNVHHSGLLLPWHRHYLFLWEKALQEECGYIGSQPYWNWASPMHNSPTAVIFGDEPTSIGSDGAYEPDAQTLCDYPGECPHQYGGGCINSGPFKDFQIHMGPIDQAYFQPNAPFPPNAFDYNPRCASRSINYDVLARNNNQTTVDRLLSAQDIIEVQLLLDPHDHDTFGPGAHGGGHMAIGTTMNDGFASPQDPMFWLHHGMVDRMWTLWQARDPVRRHVALNGTTNLGNPPGTPEVTLDTVMEFGVLDRPRTVREAMDTMDYDYFYDYD